LIFVPLRKTVDGDRRRKTRKITRKKKKRKRRKEKEKEKEKENRKRKRISPHLQLCCIWGHLTSKVKGQTKYCEKRQSHRHRRFAVEFYLVMLVFIIVRLRNFYCRKILMNKNNFKKLIF